MGRSELSCYSSSEFQAAAPPVSYPINSSPGSYEWRIGSDLQALGELVWWSSFDGAGASDVGVERECFFRSLNICGASSLPPPVLLNLSTCTTELKLLTQRTLSNSIPCSHWLSICAIVCPFYKGSVRYIPLGLRFPHTFWLMKEKCWGIVVGGSSNSVWSTMNLG